MTITAGPRAPLHLPAPASLEEAGLTGELVSQLVLKTLHFGGELTGTDLARRLGLPFHIIEPALAAIKQQYHLELSGGVLGTPSYRYRITDAGRVRALLFLEQSHYVGVAPVPLEQYRIYMAAFKQAPSNRISRAAVRDGFRHLVLSQRMLDQIGPAVNGGHSMFVYGPPGNGKTVISQAIHNLLEGEILVPHAIEVGGSIIRFFDPVNHAPVDEPVNDSLDLGTERDRRWVRCRRPIVTVGGELTLDQLELSYSPELGFYRAPVQALANGGLLVIDDFGRQSCSPRELLNRWIVPLESGVDFLSLHSGQKLDFPFLPMIVFATDVRPHELVDEGFLRRIHYKIFAESPTRTEFLQIFENCCTEYGLEYRPEVIEDLLASVLKPRQIQLRACQPRDLIRQVISVADYRGETPELRLDLLEAACDAYFVNDRESPASYA